jgi:hypothetical protein
MWAVLPALAVAGTHQQHAEWVRRMHPLDGIGRGNIAILDVKATVMSCELR